MIVVRAADARRYERSRGKQEVWLTFHPNDLGDPLALGFGPLQTIKEGRLPPRAGMKEPVRPAEILTYVFEGALAFEDAIGRSGVIHAGEFQRMTAGDEVRYSETNASPTSTAHFFQFRLQPPKGAVHTSVERKLIGAVQRRGQLFLVASPTGRGGSLTLGQDACFYSAILNQGQHLAHALEVGRSAWLHVVKGTLSFEGRRLEAGDGVGIYEQAQVSFTAAADAEVLLIDMNAMPTIDPADFANQKGERQDSSSNGAPSGENGAASGEGGIAEIAPPISTSRKWMRSLIGTVSSAFAREP